MKHTPGPWTFCCKKCFSVGAKDGPIAEIIKGDWGDEYPAVRTIDGRISGTAVEAYMEMSVYGHVEILEATANARLIAAAPDMLEALEAVEEYLEDINSHYTIEIPLLVMVRSALAKARGES